MQTLRLHVPVLTSDRNFIFVDGALAHVRPGQLFYFNNLLTHAAFNLDDGLNRSHLIMDIQPDAELRDLVIGGQAPEPVAPAVYEALGLACPEAI